MRVAVAVEPASIGKRGIDLGFSVDSAAIDWAIERPVAIGITRITQIQQIFDARGAIGIDEIGMERVDPAIDDANNNSPSSCASIPYLRRASLWHANIVVWMQDVAGFDGNNRGQGSNLWETREGNVGGSNILYATLYCNAKRF